LREADQMQRSGTKIISGHYKLVDDKWESNIFKNE
jgi:hypothetical protein